MPRGGRRVRIFSALEVANICGVVNQTTINWIRNGHLKAFTTPGGQYRIYAKDLAAFLDNRGMADSGEVLQIMMENANWDTFLIAADLSSSANLKNGIENGFPDFDIFHASDWFEIGRKVTEEKPGFILLDAEMPGADVVKFIRTLKEDPVFGKPYIFLLTSSRKVEASSAYKADLIFTKPLELGKLKAAMRNYEKLLSGAVTA